MISELKSRNKIARNPKSDADDAPSKQEIISDIGKEKAMSTELFQ